MTEKDYNPERRNKKAIVGNPKQQSHAPVQKPKHDVEKKEISEEKIEDKKSEEVKIEETQAEHKHEDKHAESSSAIVRPSEVERKKKPVQTKPKEKKFDAVVNCVGIPISTKKSVDMCRAIKGKKVDDAIEYLEAVISKKKALPMKGEYAHQKGIMSGRFPKKTAEYFIVLLKSLKANAIVNEIEAPKITEAIANKASKPYARFGAWRRKRTHVRLVAKSGIKNSEGGK